MNAAAREQVLIACKAYYQSIQPPKFVPGETYIPAAGKLLTQDDLVNLVDASLDMWLTAGRYASELEEQLAAKFGGGHARLTVSGSAANLLSFAALTSSKLDDRRVRPGSEVLTVAAAFPTTVAPIVQYGCVPVFVDIDRDTCNVNVEQLAAAVSPRTRVIILGHTLGNPFNLAAVATIAGQHDLFLIEDCCDAFGATFDGCPVGSWGEYATLSFYPAHQMTMGEGGAVITKSKFRARILESLRDWGRDCWCAPGKDNTCGKRFSWTLGDLPFGYDHKYIYTHLGYNLKVTDMQAAIGLSQLSKLDTFVAKRRENFAALTDGFLAEGIDEHFVLPKATPRSEPSWFGYMLTIRDESPLTRRDVVTFLEDHKIGTRLLFGGNLVRQPALAGVDYRIFVPLENTDRVMKSSFWIGVWPGITAAHRGYMIDTFKSMIRELAK